MTLAAGSNLVFSYILESVWGTTPTTPAFQKLNIVSTNIGLSKESFQSESINNKRQVLDHRHGVRDAAGDIPVEFRASSFDDFLQALMMGTWSSDVLKCGSTRRSFTIERNFSDIGKYRRTTGAELNSFSLEVPVSGIVKGTFGIIGKDDTGASSAISGATYTADNNNQPMTALSGAINIGGSPVAIITAIKLSITNDLTNNAVVGSDVKIRGAAGRIKITGEISAYFEDFALTDLFDNETESAITLTLSDDANSYEFDLPKVKFNGGKPEVGGEKEVTLSLPFQAIYDETDDTTLTITRTIA